MRIVLDTNVYVSAILFGGKPQQVLDTAISRRAEVFVSDAIVSEIEDVLRRPKFSLTAEFVRSVMAEVTALTHWVAPVRHVSATKEDPADNDVIDCAVEARAEYVVSGDAHLLRLGEFEGIRIVDADTFLRLMEDTGA